MNVSFLFAHTGPSQMLAKVKGEILLSSLDNPPSSCRWEICFLLPLTVRQRGLDPSFVGIGQIGRFAQLPFSLVRLARQDMTTIRLGHLQLSTFGDFESFGDTFFRFE